MSERAQTSIEFIILLACVSTLSLSGILLYKNLATQNGKAISLISNKSLAVENQTYVPASKDAPYLDFYLPPNSTVGVTGRMQIDAYGCDDGHAQVSIYSNTLSFSRNEINLTISGIAVANVSFEPIQIGKATGLMQYSITCPSANSSGSYPLWTYVSYPDQQSSGQQDYYAIISDRNESIVYGLINSGGIENFTTFNHCTYVNFWTVPYGVPAQCGYDAGASDYRLFDGSCLAPDYPYTRTYCDVPEPYNYNVSQLNGSYSLKYSFNLDLQTLLGLATVNISSASQNAIVYSDGQAIGTASVLESYAPSYVSQQVLVTDQNQSYYGNTTVYSEYVQAYDNLNNLLQFYNNTEITDDIQSSIQASMYEVSTTSSELVGSLAKAPENSCRIYGELYECLSQIPFTYDIDVNLPSLQGQNQSLYYAGTLIRIT